MIRLVNFSDDKMTRSQMLCTDSAYTQGVDQVFQYSPTHMDAHFCQFNEKIVKAERGAGYWLWKPYFINRAMGHCEDGDILIYSDSGVEWIAPVNHIIDAMDQDIFLFSNGHQHVHWCKMDVLEGILPDSFKNGYGDWLKDGNCILRQQVQASVIFFKVNQKTRDFVKEWLLWCQMPGFIDDNPSVLPNHREFAEHRHDQAILTCLQIKYNFKLHWWADSLWYESQRERWPEDKYPSMFRHHRKRNNEYT